MELNQLVHGLSYSDYATIGVENKALRSSMINHGLRSMAHLRHAADNPTEPSKEMILGTHVHSCLATPKDFQDRLLVMPVFTGLTKDGKQSTQSKEAKQAKAEWLAAQSAEAIIVDQEDYERIVGMVGSILRHKSASDILRNSIMETSLLTQDDETGISLLCRPDAVHELGYPADVKTTWSARESDFRHMIFHKGGKNDRYYASQASHYSHCLKMAGLQRRRGFTFIAVENKGTYATNVICIDEHQLENADRDCAHVRRAYAESLRTGEWPAYGEKAVMAVMPSYVQYDSHDWNLEHEEV